MRNNNATCKAAGVAARRLSVTLPSCPFLPDTGFLLDHRFGLWRDPRRQFTVLDAIGDHINGEPFGVADGFFPCDAIGHHPGQFQQLSNPASIDFPVDLNR